MFYFARFLIKLKKSGSALGKRTGQSALEYFVLFAAIAVIALLSVSTFYVKSQKTAEIFFNKTTKAIVGEKVDELKDLSDVTATTAPKCAEDCVGTCPYHQECAEYTSTPSSGCSGKICMCLGRYGWPIYAQTIESYMVATAGECSKACCANVCTHSNPLLCGCAQDVDCSFSSSTPYCDWAISHSCVSCMADTHCPEGTSCVNNTCTAGCHDTSQCSGSTPYCYFAEGAALGTCVQCLEDSHCSGGYLCQNHVCTEGQEGSWVEDESKRQTISLDDCSLYPSSPPTGSCLIGQADEEVCDRGEASGTLKIYYCTYVVPE